MPSAAIAITGIGAISAAGAGTAPLRLALRHGADGLARQTIAGLPLAAEVPVAAVSGRPGRGSRTLALARHAAREALAGGPAPGAVGLALGSCTGGMRDCEGIYLDGGPAQRSRRYRRQPIGAVATALHRELGLGGPLTCHAEACASAAGAVAEAVEWLRAGLCGAVLVVGADPLTRITMAGFASLQVIDPAGCRPFSTDRAGMSLGEGAVALLLEDAAHARARAATPLAWLRGWGLRADAHHGTAPDPSGRWLAAAIGDALADAGAAAAEVGLVVAHGTGTRDNDAAEAAAVGAVLGGPAIASVKRSVGHTMGAAAAFNLAAACWALADGILPASGGAGAAAIPGIDLLRAPRPARPAAAVATCLAFGGVDAAFVVGRA